MSIDLIFGSVVIIGLIIVVVLNAIEDRRRLKV